MGSYHPQSPWASTPLTSPPPRSQPSPAHTLSSRVRALVVWNLVRPLSLVAFWIRQRREWARIIPTRWLSPGELLTQDLESYEPKGRDGLDSKFIDDFAKARDDLLSQIKKQIFFSVIVFIFLASNYLGIKLGLSFFGFSISDAPGAAEGLLLVSNLVACYTILLQGNVYLIDTAIKYAITRAIPEELRLIYLVRYFPHEHFGRYQPFNLPHLIPNRLSRAITKIAGILFLLLIGLVALSFAASNIGLLLYFLWFHAQFGMASYILLAFILTCGLCTTLYVFLTRFRLPYLDYTVNHELELLKQENPRLYERRLNEIYGRINDDKRSMQAKGFLS